MFQLTNSNTDEKTIEYVIDDCIYNFYKINNVSYFMFNNDTYNCYDIKKYDVNGDINDEQQVYFILDTCMEKPFGHWVFECAIFLPVIHLLKKDYANIKMVILQPRKYKKLFLEYFGLNYTDPGDVVFMSDTNLKPNNICIIPRPNTALNERAITPEFKNYIDTFFRYFDKETTKTIDVLMVPRQHLENCGNIRVCDTSDIENFMISNNIGTILHTDHVEKLEDQISAIGSAKTIVITDGSPFIVNMMFAKNSKVIFCDMGMSYGVMSYPKYNYILSKHFNNKSNNIISIRPVEFKHTEQGPYTKFMHNQVFVFN